MTTYKGIFTDPDKLMYRNQPTDSDVVFYRYMPGKSRDIGHDDIIAEMTVVGNMAIGHQKTVVSYRSIFIKRCRTVDSYEFPECVIISYNESGRFSPVFKILTSRADNSRVIEMIISTDHGMSIEDYI